MVTIAHFIVAILYCIFSLAYGSESFHGGTFLAMAGKDSVVIASDSRFSSYQTGPFLLGQFPRSVFRVGSKTLVCFYGLDSDARTIVDKIQGELSNIGEDHLYAKNIARVLSDTLYSSGLQCSPIVVGLKDDGLPHICSMDGLGAQTVSESFAVSGTANSGLYAICESIYEPDLSPNELAKVVEKCLRLALQRDVLSGCSVRIHTILKDGIYSKDVEMIDA
mmetsp:Transcript_11804/g.11443  ORF Transcript_11804/g.11443 Transcript_11804/m.11443 type:complete len:221 (-) Transcript_11804:555-1217(-)